MAASNTFRGGAGRGEARALGLAGALVALGFASGCLVGDFSTLEEYVEPPTSNNPPTIDPSLVSPTTSTCVRISPETTSDTCLQQFLVKVVHDKDVDDKLYARWFIDLDRSNLETPWLFAEPLARRSLVARGPELYLLDARRFTSGPHVLSLYVSDGFLENEYDTLKVAGEKDLVQVSWCVLIAGDCGVTP